MLPYLSFVAGEGYKRLPWWFGAHLWKAPHLAGEGGGSKAILTMSNRFLKLLPNSILSYYCLSFTITIIMCALMFCNIFGQLFCSDILLVWLWCQWLFRVWRDETSVSCLSPMTCFPSQGSHDDSEDNDEYHDNMMRMMRMSMRIMMGMT